MIKRKKKNNKNLNLKESYDLFRKQLELADKAKISKIKVLYSEMHNSNKEEPVKNKFLRSLTNNKIKFGIFLEKNKNNENDVIKDEDEEEKKNHMSNNEKNKLLLDEMNLINEIKYYISTMDDPESQRKFESLLKQIDSMRKLDTKEYIRQLKENFGILKNEIADIFRVKEIEDRINGFINNLDRDINRCEVKRNFYEGLINIVDHKFKSIIENDHF